MRALNNTPERRSGCSSTARGVFMLCIDARASHDDVLLDLSSRPKKGKFRKVLIPPQLKAEFMYQLRVMNNARSMFPGVEGSGRSIANLARFDAFPDMHRD